ncbi:type VI secretion system baseplate subunit TssK [Ideonella livida]|uniref:Type VI secretion system baseplate subunit TssK n=1 Tax=Ideonella livida TaxID=2707176 RepID=A0A7C9PGJ9_9BURK|nr:type VI secretion system baseplate subunit TssK [Ideonella livida]NDY91353.1 type VI secretion system baseplate subunit TssK [Ideonella livida]
MSDLPASAAVPAWPPERLQWHEGMLLAPQHFQQLQARTDALAAWTLLAAAPLAWGLGRLDIDTALLSAGRLRVLALDAVLPDGTAVRHDALDGAHAPLELDLAPHRTALEAEGRLAIWLTLPRERSMRLSQTPARFRGVVGEPVADEVSEAEPADLPRLLPALGLAAGPQPPGLWQALPLCHLAQDNALLRLAGPWAPMRRLERQHPLWQRAWQLAALWRSKAAYVARQSLPASSRLEDRVVQLEQRARLQALGAPLAALEAVLQTDGLHPWALYVTLAQALGPLAGLQAGGLPPLPPAYDHARPQACFEPLLDAVAQALDQVSQEHRLQPLHWQEDHFSLEMAGPWLAPRLVLGLRGEGQAALQAWMAGAAIGGAALWPSLRERRVLGAARQPVEQVPELGLRAGGPYTLFEIDTAGTGLRPGERLRIGNPSETDPQRRPLEAVLFVKG